MKPIVVVFGIDGAGKTTLSKNAAAALCGEGVRAEYRYLRLVPRVSRLAMATGRLLLGHRKKAKDSFGNWTARKRGALRSPWLARFYSRLLLWEYVVQARWRLRRRPSVCVVDRFLMDTIITDLSADLGWDIARTMKEYEKWEKRVPRPALFVYVEITPEIAMSRKNDVPDIRYLQDRHGMYQEFAKRRADIVLDGTRTPLELQNQLVEQIHARFGELR